MLTKLLLLSLAVFASVHVQATSSLTRPLVYTSRGIQSQSSDYQGTTVSGGAIVLQDFLINGDLLSAAGQPQASRASVRVNGRRGVLGADDAAGLDQTMWQWAQDLAALTAQTQCADGWYEVPGLVRAHGCVVQAPAGGVSVIDISAEQFAALSNLILRGQSGSRFVVRIHGTQVEWVGKGMFLDGVQPSQVTFYFPEATRLHLEGSGDRAIPGVHPTWGIGGNVLGPCADLVFQDALITGLVRVRSLYTEPGRRGGQVNDPGPVISCGCAY